MMNIKTWTIAISIILFFSHISAGQTNAESFVKFNIKNAGLMVDGNFSDKKAEIVYNESEPSKSKFSGEIKTTSINTGLGLRDNHLRKKDYFDVTGFPTMTFKSTVVTAISPQKLKIIGDLTIKGITKKIVLEVAIAKVQNKTIFSTSFALNRRDFKVGGSSWTLSDDLNVFIQIAQ